MQKQSSITVVKSLISNWESYTRQFVVLSGIDESYGNGMGKIFNFSGSKQDYDNESSSTIIINFPTTGQIAATYSWSDKRTLSQIERMTEYSVKPRGIMSNFKIGIPLKNNPPLLKNESEEIFTNVEQLPRFPGGDVSFGNFLKKNIIYPEVAHKNNIQGRVIVNFVVEKDGSLTDIKILRGLEGGLSEEAIRVLKLSPNWEPGIQNGRPVRVSFTIPILFQRSE